MSCMIYTSPIPRKLIQDGRFTIENDGFKGKKRLEGTGHSLFKI